MLIEPNAGACFLGHLAVAPVKTGEPPELARLRARFEPRTSLVEGVGVLEITGVLAYKPDLLALAFEGVEDSAAVLSAFQALHDNPRVGAVVLNINSPGGFSVGGAEIADAVYRASKPVVAWSGGMMCSLAYWIGSQADAVVASRSALIGSIGAYVSMVDYTRLYETVGLRVRVFKNAEAAFKPTGIPGTSLTEAQEGRLSEQAQRTFEQFRGDVRRARRSVHEDAMRGQVFDGHEAKQNRLVDALGDLGYAISLARMKALRP
ncbi:MAG: S49 family peptidase [Armatimonadetes bacterium]|nr:S49 family peptidase [Armatimonadota bacterium]